MCDGKNLPATGVNRNQSRRQQLSPLRDVHLAAIKNLVNIDLTEVVSVKGERCLRSELEQMKFSCEDLFTPGNCGQVEAKLDKVAVQVTLLGSVVLFSHSL